MKLNIAYAPDDKYINQTIVSMVSAIENNKEHEIEFIIIYSKLSEESLRKLREIITPPQPSPSGEGASIITPLQPSPYVEGNSINTPPPSSPYVEGNSINTPPPSSPYEEGNSINTPHPSSPYVEHVGQALPDTNVKIRLLQVDEAVFTNLPLSHWVTVQAWFRIKLPDMCPDLDKILYLDCDTLVLGDLSELFNTDLNGKYLAGVKDVWGVDKYCTRLSMTSGVYLNSGMLLFNADFCRQEKFFDKIINFANNNSKIIEFCDQDSINKIADEKKIVLHPKFNYMDTWWRGGYYEYEGKEEQDYLEAGVNPTIAHLTGLKPAFKGCGNKFKEEWWKYAKLTNIYPELKEDYENSKEPKEPLKDKIFSIKNIYQGKTKKKYLTVFGIKILLSKKTKSPVNKH